MTDDLRLSRITKSVAALGDAATDPHRFADKPVLLTGAPAILATENGEDTLLFALRLLVRISRDVNVVLPRGCDRIAARARALVNEIGLGGDVAVADGDIGCEGYAAILSIGTKARSELPWTAINSNGWLARVSSGATSLSGRCDQRNPIGARVAACLGVADVFKRLAAVRPERGPLAAGLLFSAFSYECGRDNPGPVISPDVVLPTFVLGGCGAIGNGIAELIVALHVSGVGMCVDKQRFGPENLGTCALMTVEDIGAPKAVRLAEIMRTAGMDVTGSEATIAELAPRLGTDIPYPRAVLGGLDRIEPRHDLQRLWADVYLDGATSPFGCQVTRHVFGEDIGCAICVYKMPLVSSDAVAVKITGLAVERLHNAEAVIEQRDVDAAKTEEQKAWLRARLGQRVCSVVPAAVLAEISTEAHPENFEPSVPFVACLAAAFVVGELVKLASGAPSPLAPRFQLDVLQGPQRGELFDEAREQSCECVTRAKNIERVRAGRTQT